MTELELPLFTICGITQSPKGTVEVKKVTAELELWMRPQAFRLRLGNRCGWRCVVTGSAVKEVPVAAHLLGKDWRVNNLVEAGVLIRTDLHRVLDRSLAELRDGKFSLHESLRQSEYSKFHNAPLSKKSSL